jgi:hypothetical protein
MTDFEIKNNLLNEVKELADNNYAKLFGSASALLTIDQLEIMKSVFSKCRQAICTKCPFYASVIKITENLIQFTACRLDFVRLI